MGTNRKRYTKKTLVQDCVCVLYDYRLADLCYCHMALCLEWGVGGTVLRRVSDRSLSSEIRGRGKTPLPTRFETQEIPTDCFYRWRSMTAVVSITTIAFGNGTNASRMALD